MADTKPVQRPSWLTPEFIQNALQHSGFKDPQVLDIDVEDPAGSGDHYSSSVLRVNANLKSETGGTHKFSVIVKSVPVGSSVVEAVNACLTTESRMLSELLPKMRSMIEAKSPGSCTRFGPICYHYGTDPLPFIVMEDLSRDGFKLGDRIQGLDLQQSIMTAKALGQYHAATCAILQEDPKLADVLVSGFIRPRQEVKTFIKTGFQSVVTACRKWENFPEEFIKILDDLTDTAIDRFSKLATPSSSTFNVILHSDFWTNNIMFAYKGERLTDVRFVDFQTSCVGPAVLDFFHLLNTSLEDNVSTDYTSVLAKEYYASLSKTMKILELKPPSLEDFASQIQSHGFYGLFGAVCIVPLVRAHRDENIDIASILEGDAAKNVSVYESPLFEKFLKRVLPVYRDKGWI